jgi:glycine/D-amino acid oxidase-like deaminating enzyme
VAQHSPSKLPASIYAETARMAAATPPLAGDKKVDVAVIGGGFTGLSSALHLAEKGIEVAVLEAHEPGWGASGRNGGQVNPGLKCDPDQIEKDFGPDLGRRMVDFSSNAPNVVFDLIRRYQMECEARQSGTIRAAYAAKNADEVRSTAEQYLRRGMPVELLERDQIQETTGTDRYICGVIDRRGGALNPLGYVRALAQAAQQAGATVHGGTKVQSIERKQSRWELKTDRGTVSADKLVIGTNGYTDGIWPKLQRSIVPVYSAILATEPLSPDVARKVMPRGAVLYENGSITVYYRLDAQNRLLMGGRSPMREIEMSELGWLQRYTERLFPALANVGWTHCWNGQLAITTDHYPHLHTPAENVMICLGYNGRGVAMSTAMGGEIARWATGAKTSELNMPVTTLKEIPFHGLWKLGASARITYGRIRDFLGI